MTEENPLSELDVSLREAVEGLTSTAADLSGPPADLDQQVLLQLKQTASPPTPNSKGKFGLMAKIIFGAVAAAVLFIGSLFGFALSGDGNSSFLASVSKGVFALVGGLNAPAVQPVRGLSLPKETVHEFADLQAIRKAGKQEEVSYLSIGWMQEFNESPVTPNADGSVTPITLDEPWRPNRSEDSHRLAFLSEFPNLKGLDVFSMYVTRADLETISSLKALEKLSLYGVQVLEEDAVRRLNPNDFAKLSSLTKLRELDLSQSEFEGGGEQLAKLPELEALYFGSFAQTNDRSLADLQKLPKLTKLAIAPVFHPEGKNHDSAITDAGLESLKSFPALKELLVAPHGEKFAVPIERVREMLPDVTIKETNQALLLPHIEQ